MRQVVPSVRDPTFSKLPVRSLVSNYPTSVMPRWHENLDDVQEKEDRAELASHYPQELVCF